MIKSVKELEKNHQDISLDIEFAQNSTGKLFLLQVRPLILQKKISEKETIRIEKRNFKFAKKNKKSIFFKNNLKIFILVKCQIGIPLK